MNGIVPAPAIRAMEVDTRLREIDREAKMRFVEIGCLVIEAEERELWRHLADAEGNPYRSWDHWVSNLPAASRSSAYSARTLVRDLSGLPMDDLCEVPRSNLPLLKGLPARKRGKWLESAKLPRRQFLRVLIEGEPDYHFEEDAKLIFKNLTVSQKEMIEGALELAMARNETESREQALEAICSNYLLDEK